MACSKLYLNRKVLSLQDNFYTFMSSWHKQSIIVFDLFNISFSSCL